MIGSWTDAEDRLLARSVFGTDDPGTVQGMILDWTARQGFGRARVAAVELSVGAVATVVPAARSRIVVKVWPGSADPRALAAQMQAQARMAARGFPAPPVLTGLSALGPGWAVAMGHDRSGVPPDARFARVRRAMAAGLARFVAEATETCRGVDGLPPWLPPEGTLWPKPHNALFDFEATERGAKWIDDVARPALRAVRWSGSRAVVGHRDWSAKNMRLGSGGVAVLYDWDSVFLGRETWVVGDAARQFSCNWDLHAPENPAIGEVAAFVRDYEAARGVPFTASELTEVAAAATYGRAYTARCEHAIDPDGARWRGSARESLMAHGPFRFHRAGESGCASDRSWPCPGLAPTYAAASA
jgi:hypothetical protein